MPVYDKYNFLLLPKMLVLNPKDGDDEIGSNGYSQPPQGTYLIWLKYFVKEYYLTKCEIFLIYR